MTFKGVIPAVVTPFTPDLAIDEAAVERNIAALVEAGIGTVVATGTMGEAGSLDDAERGAITSLVVRTAGSGVRVIAGISGETANDCIRFARIAEGAGASGLQCLPPVLYAADEHETVAFYREITSATQLPLIAYNNPGASKTDMSPELIARLAEIDGLVAVKECSGDARRIASIVELTDGALDVLVGGDDWALEGFFAGAVGWISGCANVAPRECIELFELCARGRVTEARALYLRLLPLARLDMTAKLVQYYKAALDAVGLGGGPSRPPRLPLSEHERGVVSTALAALQPEFALR